MAHRIITISRQFGSGGRTIGKEAAEKLGIPCYDQQLIELAAKESGFSEKYVQEHGEQSMHTNWLSQVFSDRVYNNPYAQDAIWEAQRAVILDLAQKGPCVIVGRCADFILRDTADCLRVFIHADMEKRAERIVKVYGETEDAPIKRITDKDKRRRAYYQLYTDSRWGEAENYHISLDSGALGFDTCVKILTGLY